MDDVQRDFRRQFRSAFGRRPKRPCRSERGRDLWIDTEAIRDCIAGPLYQIFVSGGCAYVYQREDRYFAGVDDPDELKSKLREWLDELFEDIEQFLPRSADELSDQESMRQNAAEIQVAVQTAIEIELARHKHTDPDNGK